MSSSQMFALLLLPGLHMAQPSGLALVGGDGSSELWVSAPGELHCSLPSLDRAASGLSLDSWGSSLLACQGDTCDQLTPSGWQPWGRTRYFRWYHTSAVTSQGLLLAGGRESLTTTELLPWEGGESREGFSLQHKRNGHCSIQPSPDKVILTGGEYTSLVTEYSGLDAGEEVPFRELPPLPTRRSFHACGCYGVGTSQVRQLTPFTPKSALQVLLVTGGSHGGSRDTTELLPYTGLGGGSWRTAGRLPSARAGLRAAQLGDLLHVTGGYADDLGDMEEVLVWDSVSESWAVAGHLGAGSAYHGLTEVSPAVVADYCSVN